LKLGTNAKEKSTDRFCDFRAYSFSIDIPYTKNIEHSIYSNPMKFPLTVLTAAVLIGMVVLPASAFRGKMYGSHNHTNLYKKAGIQLTADQKAKMEAIETEAKAKINAIYTAEQRSTMNEARNARKEIQLTAEQKQKLTQLRTDYRKDLKAILTPEQQQQLSQKRGNHSNKHQGGRHGYHYGNSVERLKAKGITLTATQESQLTELNSKYKAAMASVYTPAQRETSQAAKDKWKSVQLTTAQREQIKAIRKEAWQAKKNVLTPEQQQKLPQRWNSGNQG
jgi:Spy/CpxP family protein refolding chaperone